ncbi:DEAD/DEAH box helicase [Rhodobaculum claviforme]|uniref:Helicase SNF2 n=1 Tax=Rhodobaculum claviforme TaxID=1549854 RepID=A0A934WJ92_9RHOB|nr:DEAD/DEAH box helicase [Rhodobaculum claviforme]MBK5927283.1 hypothetical protein [Rhodobaculum claviforme]
MAISISAHFDHGTMERAEEYVRTGRVVAVGRGGAGLQAQVRNSAGKFYEQNIALVGPTGRHPQGRISGACSCPVGRNCKHVAAALIAWVQRVEVSGRSVPAPAAGPLGSWLRRVEALQATPAPVPAAAMASRPPAAREGVRDRLLYVLDLRDPGMRVDLRLGRINAAGTGLNKSMPACDVLLHLRHGREPDFLQPGDLDLLAQLARARVLTGQAPVSHDLPAVLQAPQPVGAPLLRALCATGRLLAGAHPDAVLSWSEDVLDPTLGWVVDGQGGQTLGFMSPDGAALQVARFGADGVWLDLAQRRIGALSMPVADDVLRLVLECPVLARAEVATLQGGLPDRLGDLPLPAPRRPRDRRRAAHSRTARLVLSAAQAHLGRARHGRASVTLPTMTLRFVYDGQEVDGSADAEPCRVEGTDLVTIARDRDWEDACRLRLHQAGAIPVEDLVAHTPTARLLETDFVFVDDEIDPLSGAPTRRRDGLLFTFRTLPHLRVEGWAVEVTAQWPFRMAETEAQLLVETRASTGPRFGGHGWFDLGFAVEIKGQRHDLAPLLAAFLEQLGEAFAEGLPPDDETLRAWLSERPVFVEQGRAGYVPVDLSPIAPVLRLFVAHHLGAGRMHPGEAGLAAEVAEALAGSDVRFADHAGIMPLARSLAALATAEAIAPPAGLLAELRPYQAFGAAWMGSLVAAGFGGVLADDMGLGKTVQVLALLQARLEQARGDDAQRAPALLVVPTSLLHGWQEQAARFAPALRLLVLHGPGRMALQDRIPEADLVITTYPLLARDRAMLAATRWGLVIVDEAQVLKNPAAQMAKALREIPAEGRLALTGTPMENSLQDLWTLFDWAVPGLLGDRKTFQSAFRTPIEKHGNAAAQARLNRRLRPFLLRRTKDAVAADLPPRTEILDRVELSRPQQALYEAVRSAMDVRVREAIARRGLAAARITILDALLKLRQVCCDPALVPTEAARGVRDSAKRARLRALVEELVAEGRRVLIFSQFTEMLALIAGDLDALGIRHLTLTGRTRNRAGVLDAFRSGDAPVFLISLKAGGVGLTLTEADTVVLYDPWWNPAVERQAMDRTHRIGQNKPVFVHRLVAAGTVEEKILALQARKQALADAVFAEREGRDTDLIDEATLVDLFAPLHD